MFDDNKIVIFDTFDTSGLSKPANTLIEKISNAIGIIYEPTRIRRLARAEQYKRIRETETNIQIRAMDRKEVEEIRKQQNMESILFQATNGVSENADASKMNDDWIVNFFEQARNISDKQMQELWARLLAREANNPGSFSRRTVNLLNDLDKTDAELYEKLYSFCWCVDDKNIPLIFDIEADIYQNNGISLQNIHHLENIGLINTNTLADFKPTYKDLDNLSMIDFRTLAELKPTEEKVTIQYFNQSLALEIPKKSKRLKSIFWTKSGIELMSVCEGAPIDGFMEYVKDQWKEFLPKE